MQFTGDVSLGTLLTILTLLGIALRFGYRLGHFETTLKDHADRLSGHAARLSTYEEQIVNFVGDLQRVIGRMEVTDRRRSGR